MTVTTYDPDDDPAVPCPSLKLESLDCPECGAILSHVGSPDDDDPTIARALVACDPCDLLYEVTVRLRPFTGGRRAR